MGFIYILCTPQYFLIRFHYFYYNLTRRKFNFCAIIVKKIKLARRIFFVFFPTAGYRNAILINSRFAAAFNINIIILIVYWTGSGAHNYNILRLHLRVIQFINFRVTVAKTLITVVYGIIIIINIVRNGIINRQTPILASIAFIITHKKISIKF